MKTVAELVQNLIDSLDYNKEARSLPWLEIQVYVDDEWELSISRYPDYDHLDIEEIEDDYAARACKPARVAYGLDWTLSDSDGYYYGEFWLELVEE